MKARETTTVIRGAGRRAALPRRRDTWTARSVALCCAGVLCLAAFTGCAPVGSDFSEGVAPQLQASVLAITDSAAAGHVGQAIGELDALQAKLKEATASGAVGAARSARIQASIDLVRADLVSALPAPSSTSTPATEPAPDESVPDEPAPDTRSPGNQGNQDDKGKRGHKEDKDH